MWYPGNHMSQLRQCSVADMFINFMVMILTESQHFPQQTSSEMAIHRHSIPIFIKILNMTLYGPANGVSRKYNLRACL